jgi:hypothetical protein
MRERGLYHQQHQVGERKTSSISSWSIDWCIYKSSKVFFIDSIIILKGMQSSFASICISVKLIHHHHHHSTRLAHHNNTRLALRHSYPAGSTFLVSSHHLALRHSYQDGIKMLVLLYVTTIRSEAGYQTGFTSQLSSWKFSASLISSSFFTSQPSGQKQGTRPTLCHNHQVKTRILDWLYVTAI